MAWLCYDLHCPALWRRRAGRGRRPLWTEGRAIPVVWMAATGFKFDFGRCKIYTYRFVYMQHTVRTCIITSLTSYIYIYILSERSLEVKLPTIWTDEKQRRQSEEKVREENIKEEKVRESQKKEDAGA